MTPTTEPELKLSKWQHQAWWAEDPIVASVTPIRDGKTYLWARWLVSRVWTHPDSIALATANTHKQVDRVIVPEIQKACQEFNLPCTHRANAGDFKIQVGPETGTIHLAAVENPKAIERIRGTEYGSVWMDEARDNPEYAFQVCVTRTSCTKVPLPLVRLGTTTKGKNWLYKRFVKQKPDGHRLIHVRHRTNEHLDPGFDDRVRAAMDSALAEQELSAGWVSLSGLLAYRAFTTEHNVKPVAYNPNEPVYLNVDWGWGSQPMAWTLAHMRGSGPSRAFHLFAEIYIEGTTLEHMANVLKSGPYGGHLAGFIVGGDATDGRSLQTGLTNREMLSRALQAAGVQNFRMDFLRSNPSIVDRVNAVNTALRNANGGTHLFIDPSCENVIEDMEEVEWDSSGTKLDKSDDARTHASDGFGYVVARHMPLRGVGLTVEQVGGGRFHVNDVFCPHGNYTHECPACRELAT